MMRHLLFVVSGLAVCVALGLGALGSAQAAQTSKKGKPVPVPLAAVQRYADFFLLTIIGCDRIYLRAISQGGTR